MPSRVNIELARQCKRNYESCLWNSTILFICLRWHRNIKTTVTVVPIIFGSTPGITTLLKLLSSQTVTKLDVVSSILSFISGMVPLIYNALKFDDHLENLKKASVEYRNLQDQFRILAEASIYKSTADFEADTMPCMARLEQVRAIGLTTPEWALAEARKKINAGHYDFEVDQTPMDTKLITQVDTTATDVRSTDDTESLPAVRPNSGHPEPE
jgi:hypothetical protein